MIHGIYLDPLGDIFANYSAKYYQNKDLLKDSNPKTIQTFMQNFMEFGYLSQIRNVINYDNFKEFCGAFFNQKIHTKIIKDSGKGKDKNQENSISSIVNEADENPQIKEEKSQLDQLDEIHLLLKFFFFENCLIVFKMNEIFNSSNYQEILNHFFNVFITKFDTAEILLNMRVFKFILKSLISISVNSVDWQVNLQNLYQDIFILVPNLTKRNLITLFFLIKVVKLNRTDCNWGNIIRNIVFMNTTIKENSENFINFLTDIKNIIHQSLPDANENLLIKTENSLIQSFQKFFSKIKHDNLSTSYNYIVDIFLSKLNQHENKFLFEGLVFLYEQILSQILKASIDEEVEVNKLRLLYSVLKSNIPIFHRLSVDILGHLKTRDLIPGNFMDKFISVYDVLDGFNSHLFKGLWKDFETVILTCENYHTNGNILVVENFYVESSSKLSIRSIFSNPFNYFKIISHKIKDHENARIQKFFIKSFTNLSTTMQFKNRNFEDFIFTLMMKMLDNPLFYPENESISYHAKIGLVAENLFSFWLAQGDDFAYNLKIFLKSIVKYIKLRRIFIYLLNSIGITILSKNNILNYKLDSEILESINKLLETNVKYLSIYQKQKSWETISLIILKANNLKEFYNNVEMSYLFSNFFNVFLFKDNFNYLSIENVNLMQRGSLNSFSDFISCFKDIFSLSCLKLDQELDYLSLSQILLKFRKSDEAYKNLSDDLILTICIYKFIYDILPVVTDTTENLENETLKCMFKLFKKFTSSYINNEDKSLVLSAFLKYLKLSEVIKNIKNSQQNYFYFENYIENLFVPITEYFNNVFINFRNGLLKIKDIDTNFNQNEVFLIDNMKLIEEIFQRSFSHIIDNTTNLKDILQFKMGNFLLIFEFISSTIMNIYKSKENFTVLQNMTENKLKILHLVSSYLKIHLMNINYLAHISNEQFGVLIQAHKLTNLIDYFSLICDFTCDIENILDKDKSWIKNQDVRLNYTETFFNCIKSRCLILNLWKIISENTSEHNNDIINKSNQLMQSAFSNKPLNYAYSLCEALEKSNEEDIYYILKFIGHFLHFYSNQLTCEELEEFLNYFLQLGLKTLTEKRENLNYMNTITFLSSFLNLKIIQMISDFSIISNFLNKLSDLNEKRTWLLLRLSSQLLLDIFDNNFNLISKFTSHILQLVEAKETRGEDSFMLQTSPTLIFSPFNINPQKFCKKNLFSEDTYKYGLYIRLSFLNFFDNKVKSLLDTDSQEGILNLITSVLHLIDLNSTSKAEMQFTAKHRRKLRLSQFVLILSQIFDKLSNTDLSNSFFLLMKKVFEKVNLYSVRFYLDLCCLNFAKNNSDFLNYLISCLSDPSTKTHCVTSSLIILSTLLLNRHTIEIKSISNDLVSNIYQKVASLCTSNICNIRGFAQFFVYKIRSENLVESKQIEISELFYNYLAGNTNIKRFFNKFDSYFTRYTELVRSCSVDKILLNNFDEVNCEIMPCDILKKFKQMAIEIVELENEDLTKPYISWREFETDHLGNNNIFATDFQKKYRPLDENAVEIKKKRRLDVIVMASLINKAPNLGGLARTCEVFNLGAMTINSESFLNDNAFLTAAASAERWLPILNLPAADIEHFIKAHRKFGYLIVGLEQTANSVQLKQYNFKEKCLIVLGNEKEGIPQNIIQLIDVCVIIPQFGEVRSLNVHVSAALMLWELVNKCNSFK